MDTRILIAVVGVLAILVVAVILRYRSAGEVKFSIRDLLTFSFRGSNLPDDNKTAQQESSVTLNKSSLVAEEFIGRDKITHIHTSAEPEQPSQLPQLTLKLFTESGVYQDEIVFNQPQLDGVVQDYYPTFGLALQNTAKASVPAKEIDIHIEISWRGDDPQSTPRFDMGERTIPGWEIIRSKVQQVGNQPRPALLDFHGAGQDRCAFGHPLEWTQFRLWLSRKVNGYFLIEYRISSTSPHTTSDGKLKTVLQ